VNIEILHIEECDNWHEAEVPFAGSPTILLDGTDAFPSDGRTTELACRIYPTATGFAGMPTVEQLIEVLGKTK
jgi:hypothetical protein